MAGAGDDGGGPGTDAVGQRRRPGTWTRWTRKQRAAFLDVLTATCDIHAAAAAIDVLPMSAHRLRRRDPVFAAEWTEALDAGLQLLETHLVGVALVVTGAVELAEGARAPGNAADFEIGFRILRHRLAARDRPTRAPRPTTLATREDTDAAILRKLVILEATWQQG